MKRHAPAADRNKDAITAVLGPRLPASGVVLELASGSGQHAVHLARAFPALTWQPSDVDPAAVASVAAWRAEAALPNLRPPLTLDVTADAWERRLPDPPVAAFNANMIHISPWECGLGLLAGLGRALPAGGCLFLYGPFRLAGRFTAESNAAFDASLRAQDDRWGVRDIDDVAAAAAAHGLTLREQIAMPANNHVMVFERVPTAG
jgi:SAM-dependent methyltransferase